MVGRVSEGEIVLKRAQVNFQSEEVVLPSRISMYRAAGRTKDMEAQLALCQKSSDSDIRKSCQDATQSAKDQAVVAKREDGASTFLNDGSATFLNAIGSRIGM